ncbi:hypothetical protein PAPHI01_2468 [Pancytospora philotis]|nr:hypothetical protein PAPHI01_2468 [Pancytospora philotis]
MKRISPLKEKYLRAAKNDKNALKNMHSSITKSYRKDQSARGVFGPPNANLKHAKIVHKIVSRMLQHASPSGFIGKMAVSNKSLAKYAMLANIFCMVHQHTDDFVPSSISPSDKVTIRSKLDQLT